MNEIERAIDTCKQVAKSVPEYCADDLSITSVKALEKQIPKKPREGSRAIKVGIDGANCSVCGALIFSNHKYCHECGQKLDWKKED